MTFTAAELEPGKCQFEEAAEIVAELYGGTPVRASAVARRLGIDPACGNGARLLKRAAQDGLVKRVNRTGWVPLPEPAEAVN